MKRELHDKQPSSVIEKGKVVQDLPPATEYSAWRAERHKPIAGRMLCFWGHRDELLHTHHLQQLLCKLSLSLPRAVRLKLSRPERA